MSSRKIGIGCAPIDFSDVGRPINSCTIRALALCLNIPMRECIEYAQQYGYIPGNGMDNRQITSMLKGLGFTIVFTNHTYGQFVKTHPEGTYYVVDRDHASCVKDGKVWDFIGIGKVKKLEYFVRIF